jgi:tRNA pseudouridine38-40 synthase
VARTLKLTLEYDGRGFHGWQAQSGRAGRRTVQGVLVEAVERLTGERVAVHGAGRTDAGCHALGQVASLLLERSLLPPDAIRGGLNALLPPDVAVLAAEAAPEGFHARRSAVGKHYRYLVLCRPARSPLLAGRVWHRRARLDLAGMREAAARLVGRHDFSAFRASAGAARRPVRTLSRLSVELDPGVEDLVRVELEADGFLMHMARIIAGTLVEVGRGRMTPGRTGEILAGRDRRAAGPTAPAEGLYLVGVRYPEPRTEG